MSEATLRLVPKPTHSGTLVCYMKGLDSLGELIPAVLAQSPSAFECFDDSTLRLGFRYLFLVYQTTRFFALAARVFAVDSRWIRAAARRSENGAFD